MIPFPESDHDFVMKQTKRILHSFRRWTGREIMRLPGDPDRIARDAFDAPFALASANSHSEPILNYGNRTILKLWELSWEELRRTPGRKTAESTEQARRAQFLKKVTENGFVENYRGIRISNSGVRFKIKNAIVWNVLDERDRCVGQAVYFREWEYL